MLVITLSTLVSHSRAQSSVSEWQAKALESYPELGVPHSSFNKAFLDQVAILRERNPEFFVDASWSYKLAEQVSKTLQTAHPKTAGVQETSNFDHFKASPAASIRSEKVLEHCMASIRRKSLEDPVFAKETGWIDNRGISVKMRVNALLLAKEIDPEFMQVLGAFLQDILNRNRANTSDDNLWVKAFLRAPLLHSSTAAILDVEVSALLVSLFSETNDELFILSCLKDDDSGLFVGSSPIARDVKFLILDQVVRENCKVGSVQLGKANVVEVLLKDPITDTLSLLEDFSVQDWPMSALLSCLPRNEVLKIGTKERQGFQNSLETALGNLQKAKKNNLSSAIGRSDLGLFIKFLLWKSISADEKKESLSWLKDVQSQLKAYPNVRVRELEKLVPIMEEFFRARKKE